MDADYRARRYAKPVVFLLCLWPAAWLAVGLVALQAGDVGGRCRARARRQPGREGPGHARDLGPATPARDARDHAAARHRRLALDCRHSGACSACSPSSTSPCIFSGTCSWTRPSTGSSCVADVAKRPYVTAGFTAFLLLVPLAVTSTRGAMRRLGRRWQTLHRLVYVAAILGCVHYWWQVKADIREPLVYAGILAVLLGWRLLRSRRRRTAGSASGAARAERREADGGEDQEPADAPCASRATRRGSTRPALTRAPARRPKPPRRTAARGAEATSCSRCGRRAGTRPPSRRAPTRCAHRIRHAGTSPIEDRDPQHRGRDAVGDAEVGPKRQ